MVRRWCRQFSEGRQSVHDEDSSHTSRRTAAVLTEFGWELFDQPTTALILFPAIFTFSCTSRNSCPLILNIWVCSNVEFTIYYTCSTGESSIELADQEKIINKKMEHGEEDQIWNSINHIKNLTSLTSSKYNELIGQVTLSE
ncbi:hypothetical protein TNCV_2674401 [Trichonephila clavipes]|nr:hypothetical protein TNCV_2674401 [Trichonephila clavipes]